MKKPLMLILSICWLMVSQASYAQAKIDIGLKAGWNFANLSGINSPVNSTKNSSGFNGGVYSLFKLTKIAIQPEILYSQQGESYSYTGGTFGAKLDYINIPVMVKFYIVEGLNLQAGPQFGFLTKATGSLYNQSSGVITNDQDIKSYLNTTDISLGLGAGWDLPFGMNLTVRYNLGLSDINKYTGGTVPNNVVTSMGTLESKNTVLQFSLGYRLFKLGL